MMFPPKGLQNNTLYFLSLSPVKILNYYQTYLHTFAHANRCQSLHMPRPPPT